MGGKDNYRRPIRVADWRVTIVCLRIVTLDDGNPHEVQMDKKHCYRLRETNYVSLRRSLEYSHRLD
jgi:hypothetical protein